MVGCPVRYVPTITITICTCQGECVDRWGELMTLLLRDFLIDRYGLPDSVTMDDFKTGRV